MIALDAAQTRERLPYGLLADALEQVLRDARAGRAKAPERLHLSLPNAGVLLVMPAADARLAMVKMVSVHPDNPAQGLSAIQGEIVVMDAATGQRLGRMDGGEATARRTAALSVLAARRLAQDVNGPLLCVGAGAQARAHCQAFFEVFGVRKFFIVSRSQKSAEALAAGLRELGAEARAVERADEVLSKCSLVVTATSSSSPVLPEAVREDVFIAAVGAFTPAMAEAPAALVRRAQVYVDTLAGAKSEAGDLIQAGVDWADVIPLERVLDERPLPKGPVIFKSVGSALFDLAAAGLAFARDIAKK